MEVLVFLALCLAINFCVNLERFLRTPCVWPLILVFMLFPVCWAILLFHWPDPTPKHQR